MADLAFGETVTFTVTATMPEGITQAATLIDRLPFAPGVLEAISASIVGVGGNLTLGNGAGIGTPGTLTDRNGDAILDTATILLGNVTNAPDGVSNADDQITFVVVARLVSTPGASAGAVLTNQSTLNFLTPTGIANVTAQASAEIVAPHFQLTKSPDPTTVDAADEILYTVQLTNTTAPFSAPGFDIILSDLITDPNLSLVPGSVTISGPAGSSIVSGNGATDTQVSVAADRLGVGETLVITYRAVVSDPVPSNTILVNRADGTGDTFPGTVVGEREISGSAGAVVNVRGLTGFKSIASTSLTETRSDQFSPTIEDLAIGERITYRLEASLAEGSSTLVAVDSLPTAGVAMELLGFRVVTVGGNITLPGQPVATQVDTDGDGRPDQLTLDFGTVFNRPDNVVDEKDIIAVEVDAIVVNDPRNVAGDLLVNTAEAFLNGASVGTGSATAEVVEPNLNVNKTSSIATGDAGDEVTFTVTVSPSQTMTGPAYGLVLDDALAPGLALIPGSVTVSRGNIISGNGPSDTSVKIAGTVLLPDEPTVTITYRARLLDSVENGQVITNTAALSYESAPGVEAREYAAQATNPILVVLQPDLHKSVTFTDLPQTGTAALDPNITDVNQGETIVYRVTARLDEGTQTVTISDAMPAGLRFLRIGSIGFGANISGDTVQNGVPFTNVNNTLTFDFGTLVNHGDNVSNEADEITIDVIARAAASNAPGTQLQNDATLNVTSPSLPAIPPVVRTASEIVEVVAPDPVITKTASIVSGDAGDEVLYTVTVAQGPLASGPLLNTTISDLLLSPGLDLIAGSVTTSRGAIIAGNGQNDAIVAILPGVLNPGDAPIVVTYRARLTDAVEPGQQLVNTARLTGLTTTIPNLDSVPTNLTAQALINVDMPVTLQKSVIASSIPETQSEQFDPTRPDAAIGEVVTYRVAAALSEGTQNVVITDTLPAGVLFLGARSSTPGFSPTFTLVGQTLTANFGTVVNIGNNVDEPFNLGIDIDVRILDVPTNVAGTVLPNAADVTISSPSAPNVPGGTQTANAAAAIDVVEPALVLEKTTNAGFISPGEAIPLDADAASQRDEHLRRLRHCHHRPARRHRPRPRAGHRHRQRRDSDLRQFGRRQYGRLRAGRSAAGRDRDDHVPDAHVAHDAARLDGDQHRDRDFRQRASRRRPAGGRVGPGVAARCARHRQGGLLHQHPRDGHGGLQSGPHRPRRRRNRGLSDYSDSAASHP